MDFLKKLEQRKPIDIPLLVQEIAQEPEQEKIYPFSSDEKLHKCTCGHYQRYHSVAKDLLDSGITAKKAKAILSAIQRFGKDVSICKYETCQCTRYKEKENK